MVRAKPRGVALIPARDDPLVPFDQLARYPAPAGSHSIGARCPVAGVHGTVPTDGPGGTAALAVAALGRDPWREGTSRLRVEGVHGPRRLEVFLLG